MVPGICQNNQQINTIKKFPNPLSTTAMGGKNKTVRILKILILLFLFNKQTILQFSSNLFFCLFLPKINYHNLRLYNINE